MPPPLNAHVRGEMARQQGLFQAGMNEGITWRTVDWPWFVHDLYTNLDAYQRGLLLGVLLEEWGRMDNAND